MPTVVSAAMRMYMLVFFIGWSQLPALHFLAILEMVRTERLVVGDRHIAERTTPSSELGIQGSQSLHKLHIASVTVVRE